VGDGARAASSPASGPRTPALRELREETDLAAARLYNVTTQSFYLHNTGLPAAGLGSVQVAVAFCAFVDEARPPVLGGEHGAYAWLPPAEAAPRFAWPREREALAHVRDLLGAGHAGPLEDVLRVR
jgi:8-oxo-dGTP pyrophosphatase MutT (NUDIX family)